MTTGRKTPDTHIDDAFDEGGKTVLSPSPFFKDETQVIKPVSGQPRNDDKEQPAALRADKKPSPSQAETQRVSPQLAQAVIAHAESSAKAAAPRRDIDQTLRSVAIPLRARLWRLRYVLLGVVIVGLIAALAIFISGSPPRQQQIVEVKEAVEEGQAGALPVPEPAPEATKPPEKLPQVASPPPTPAPNPPPVKAATRADKAPRAKSTNETPPKKAFLMISAPVAGVKIAVDGRDTGFKTPLRSPIQVDAGAHAIALTAPDGRKKGYAVEIEAGDTYRVDF